LLYGGIALAMFCYMGRSRMWETGLGELAWFLFAGLVLYALMEVYRHSRSYS
jgi:1,4-dihydroxy-2-naphthoate octaprenyltransferase